MNKQSLIDSLKRSLLNLRAEEVRIQDSLSHNQIMLRDVRTAKNETEKLINSLS
jgi:hypothetical protein